MSNSVLAIRFTDENYSTRFDVSRALGTNLIDPIWSDILKYRSTMQKKLNVYDIAHSNFVVTLTEKAKSKISSVLALNARFADEFSKLSDRNPEKETLIHNQLVSILSNIAKSNGIECSENDIEDILLKRSYRDEYKPIIGYLNGLNSLSESFNNEINEDFLAKFLAIFRNEEELTSFYRMDEIKSQSSEYLVSREYEASPVHEIEFLMSSLMNFLNDSEEDPVIKVAVTLFMFNYIKPFDDFNKEMALIISKKILANCGSNEKAIFVPIEFILNDQKFYSSISKEIKKSNDLTYGLFNVLDLFEKVFTQFIDKLIQKEGHELRQSYYAGESKEEFKKEFGVEPSNNVVLEAENKEKVDKKPTFLEKYIAKQQELTEKELKNKATSMMEENPFIKKTQAHFFVRHCKLGQYYTIQQFKKCEHVVYETARTSMDNLAEQGYYKKEQIKNKFVYTPTGK